MHLPPTQPMRYVKENELYQFHFPGGRVHVFVGTKEQPIHTHQWEMESTVLYGHVTEETYDEKGRFLESRTYGQGDTYHISASRPHRIVIKEVPTVTLIKLIKKVNEAGRILPG